VDLLHNGQYLNKADESKQLSVLNFADNDLILLQPKLAAKRKTANSDIMYIIYSCLTI
jgi:hypothetical protein